MPFVSVTRLKLRSLRFLPRFAWMAFRTSRQARGAQGFRAGSVLRDRALTFWTLTLWDQEESMRRYMTAGAHRAAMPRLITWCDEASVVHWTQAEESVPSWQEADRRMRAEGRPSKVRHPSPDHASLAYRPPRTDRGNSI
ncbi:DUF3291 domain-containing protein [Methylobacterium brachythecii]|nr:DUF3291 domain-containing protein [Methylobacterium brachythecii]MBB3904618.1 hypothetical protein [Methylobacterium brachythecii]